jgi:hypothetical protein
VAASPLEPVGGMPAGPGLVEGGGKQPFHLVDGEGDETWVVGGRLTWAGRWRGMGAGVAPERGGGHGADGEGGHDQHGMARIAV